MSPINRNPDTRTLRWFAGLQVVFFGVLMWLWRDRFAAAVGATIMSLSVLLGILGLVQPTLIRWFYVGWMMAVFPIGWVISHVLMAVVYYLVLTPIAIVVRCTRGSLLPLKGNRDAPTYWQPRRPVEKISRYFRQY